MKERNVTLCREIFPVIKNLHDELFFRLRGSFISWNVIALLRVHRWSSWLTVTNDRWPTCIENQSPVGYQRPTMNDKRFFVQLHFSDYQPCVRAIIQVSRWVDRTHALRFHWFRMTYLGMRTWPAGAFTLFGAIFNYHVIYVEKYFSLNRELRLQWHWWGVAKCHCSRLSQHPMILSMRRSFSGPKTVTLCDCHCNRCHCNQSSLYQPTFLA